MPKLLANEKCTPTEQCNDLVGLSCEAGNCKCANNAFWKEEKCGIIFFLGYSIIIGLNLKIIKIVQANVNGQKCESNEQCDGTKSLACKEGVCECKENTLFWNEKSASCGSYIKPNF